jgi:hypothetical protein
LSTSSAQVAHGRDEFTGEDGDEFTGEDGLARSVRTVHGDPQEAPAAGLGEQPGYPCDDFRWVHRAHTTEVRRPVVLPRSANGDLARCVPAC